MQYQVFVQNQSNNGFIASVIGMPDCLAEGRTEEEAIEKAKAFLSSRLAQGKIVTIDVGPQAEENPALKYAGIFKDDPTFDQFLADIEAYRRQLDEEEAAK
ncbi:MAG: type II toxin-antitoxin system HicB family antitoxin [Acidobacteriota bacterium]